MRGPVVGQHIAAFGVAGRADNSASFDPDALGVAAAVDFAPRSAPLAPALQRPGLCYVVTDGLG